MMRLGDYLTTYWYLCTKYGVGMAQGDGWETWKVTL